MAFEQSPLDLGPTVWRELFEAFDTAPERYPVHTWRHEALDIWPILKTQFMLRACNLFHANKASIVLDEEKLTAPLGPISQKTPDPAYTARVSTPPPAPEKNSFAAGFNRPSRAIPAPVGKVLFWGSEIGSSDIGGFKYQRLIDPVRIVLEERGIVTTTLLTDLGADDPELQRFLVGGVHGAKDHFATMRNTYVGKTVVDFDVFDGFPEWFSEMTAIWPIDKIQTREILSSVIRQTQSCYQIALDYYRLHRLEAVFGSAFYGLLGHASAAACRDLEIPFVDIQHGVAGRGHESYHWPNAPVGGYNTLPTHYLTWGDFEASSIRDGAGASQMWAKSIAHPWVLADQLFRAEETPVAVNVNRFSAVSRQHAERSAFWRRLRERPEAKNILVSLYTDQPVDFFLELIAQAPSNWQFFIRLHPGEALREGAIEAREQEFLGLRAEIRETSSSQICELMPEMQAHLTKYSSTVLDADAFGVPSVCYSDSAEWFYPSDAYPDVSVVPEQAQAILKALADTMRTELPDTPTGIEALRQLDEVVAEIVPLREHD